ncbi:MAG: CDP-alcohol phosphatidyltransferase family protein [Bryobacterales bacterium]|nr:CDP-alcohol phosphatidyltransferase family protein [Bryobacterales bacterium]MDE0294702.1 CDP-alcohol phosphatidyltransferase family protein [Bryobacterales bacterium]MDE0436322.1 CDP-alcohol phosphatidyltransferase family protein [Bryobacterales bacterium]
MPGNTSSDVERAARAAERPQLSQVLTVPNQLTLLRMVVLPFVLISMIYGQHTASLWLFVAAAATDVIDGVVARRFNQKTRLGQYLDPIADKLLLSSCFVAQSVNGAIPWWVTILVLLRDVMIIAIVLVVVLTTSVRSFPPSLLGKANTIVQFTALLTVLLNNVIQAGWLQGVITALVAMTAVTTVFSAVHYALEVSRRLYAHPSAGEGE